VADVSTSKTLIPARQGEHAPRWYGIPVRILLLTFLGTLLCFAVSLLLAIVGVAVVAAIRGVRPNLTIAYWHVALPVALVAGGIILVLATFLEIRHYHQRKALRAIERMS
jgi:amino acid transporter